MTSPNDPWQALTHILAQCQAALPPWPDADNRWNETLQQTIEQWATPVGQALLPITEFPLIKPVSKLPGLGWLSIAFGQVDATAIAYEIVDLRQGSPTATDVQLTQKLIQDAAIKAGGIGLMTNLLPPIAITLFAVDIAAIATLQIELIYRIAAVYGNDLHSPQCRGEALTLYLLSLGGSGVIKSGLSVPEIIPVLGAILGASSDASLIWGIGQAAQQYYQTKRDRI